MANTRLPTPSVHKYRIKMLLHIQSDRIAYYYIALIRTFQGRCILVFEYKKRRKG